MAQRASACLQLQGAGRCKTFLCTVQIMIVHGTEAKSSPAAHGTESQRMSAAARGWALPDHPLYVANDDRACDTG